MRNNFMVALNLKGKISKTEIKRIFIYFWQGDVGHIMCQAIAQPDGGLVAVLEILRRDDEDAFHEEDEEIAYSYLVWGGKNFFRFN